MRIVETLNRGLIRALKSQFRSPREAVRELIDNAIDHNLGQRVAVDIDLGPSSLVITNIGGRGMGPRELAEYVSWGSSKHEEDSSIGMYGQGGKAACVYLGQGFNLLCRRAGEREVYSITDPDVLGRSEPRDYGDAAPLPMSMVPEELSRVPRRQGFVRLEVLDLDVSLGLAPEELIADAAAVYGPLIASKRVSIEVNMVPVEPRRVDLDAAVPRLPIEVVRDDLRIHGWVAKLEKGANKGNPPRPGLSFYWHGRRIEEGQWLSANQYGKGSLAAFYGELTVEGERWCPNLNKTAFTSQGTTEWREVGDLIIQQAKPVLDLLRSSIEPTRITSRDRLMARQIRGELQQILAKLLSADIVTIKEERSIQITTGGSTPTATKQGSRSRGGVGRPKPPREKNESLPRMPEIIIDAWDGPTRAETRESNGRLVIAVNKSHPAYSAANARFAIAESAIVECLRAGQLPGIDEFLSLADEALADWARLQEDNADA